MNIFDKREILLDLQGDMLTGAKEKNNDFLSLIKLENCCCNSGLSGFVQDFQVSELLSIKSFSDEYNFITTDMISVVQKYLEQYGRDFIDNLSEEEFEDLSKYDNEFYEIHDLYTNTIYKKYVENK